MRKEDLRVGEVYGSLRKDDFSAAPVLLVDDHHWTSCVGRLEVSSTAGRGTGVLAARSLRSAPADGVWDEHAVDLARLPVPVPDLFTPEGSVDQKVLGSLRDRARRQGLRLVLDNTSRWGGRWLAYTQMRRNFLVDLAVQEAKARSFQEVQGAKKKDLEQLIFELGVRTHLRWQSTPVEAHPHVHMEAVSHVQMSLESLHSLLSAALKARPAEESD